MHRDTDLPQRTKPYALLAWALHDAGQVVVTKIPRERESLAMLPEKDGLLIFPSCDVSITSATRSLSSRTSS